MIIVTLLLIRDMRGGGEEKERHRKREEEKEKLEIGSRVNRMEIIESSAMANY